MGDRESETQETFGDQPLPGDVSDQNTEEPSAPQKGDSGARDGSPEPTEDPGSAKEGGQSTGHPEHAG